MCTAGSRIPKTVQTPEQGGLSTREVHVLSSSCQIQSAVAPRMADQTTAEATPSPFSLSSLTCATVRTARGVLVCSSQRWEFAINQASIRDDYNAETPGDPDKIN